MSTKTQPDALKLPLSRMATIILDADRKRVCTTDSAAIGDALISSVNREPEYRAALREALAGGTHGQTCGIFFGDPCDCYRIKAAALLVGGGDK